jgi:hypothetical protein
MQATLTRLTIQTGTQGRCAQPWAVINHPDFDRTDYLLIDHQGFLLYQGPAKPMANGNWAKIPMKPLRLTQPEAARLLALWFADSQRPPIQGIVYDPPTADGSAGVSIYMPTDDPEADEDSIELSDSTSGIWRLSTGDRLTPGDIAATLHQWYGGKA